MDTSPDEEEKVDEPLVEEENECAHPNAEEDEEKEEERGAKKMLELVKLVYYCTQPSFSLSPPFLSFSFLCYANDWDSSRSVLGLFMEINGREMKDTIPKNERKRGEKKRQDPIIHHFLLRGYGDIWTDDFSVHP